MGSHQLNEIINIKHLASAYPRQPYSLIQAWAEHSFKELTFEWGHKCYTEYKYTLSASEHYSKEG